MRKKVPYVGQVQESECGLCCVSMLMGYYKQDIPVKTLSKTIEVGRDGVNIKKLGEALDSFGYKVSYYEADSTSLIQIADKPLILFWNKNHYVVLEKIKNGMFYIVDPNFGRGKLTLEEFNEHFSNLVLLAEPTEATKKINLRENPFKMYVDYFKGTYLDLILLLICSILSTATVLLVSIFMKDLIDRTTDSSNSILNGNMIMGLLGLMIMFIVFDLLKNNLVVIFSAKLDKSIYTGVINKLFRVPYKFYLTRNSSDILFRLNLLKSNRDFFIETLIKS
ncbi:cysteine peptidase family C39 domain-containing protein, partial [Bacillus pseudomycoides]